MPRRSVSRLLHLARRAAVALLLAIGAYAAAGLTGGAIPANAGWTQPADGITIWVEDNGIHTDLVLPKRAAGIDLTDLAPARDLADPRHAAWPYLAFGWGDKAFFLQTPRWRDLRPRTVLAAAVGSDATLMHVEHLPRPASSLSVRPIRLRPDEYRRLAAFIRASFRPSGQRYRGYDRYDAFYDATGRYSALATCNAWTGRALRHAGVRIGAWTPFPATVMGWFTPAPAPSSRP